MIKKLFVIAVCCTFICSLVPECPAKDKKNKAVRTFEGGKLFDVKGVKVLRLEGNYREMGRQYGGLLKKEIKEFYDLAIEKHYVKDQGLSFEMIEAFSQAAFELYPVKFKDLVYGMSETSQLSVEKIMILEQILAIQFIKTEAGGCSAIAAWGDYTGGGPLVLGRNYDSTVDFKEFSSFLNVVVYNPVDDIPTAVLCYPGEVTSFTAMNKSGIFFEINEGMKSGGNIVIDDRLIFPVEAVSFLMDYSDIKQVDAAMKTVRSNYAFIVQVADKEKAYSYEVPVFGIKRRDGSSTGLFVATNHFVDPSWGISPPVDAEDRTVQRREQLLALAEKDKGKITFVKMMDIMDTPFKTGGATWPERTAYQVVVVPSGNTLWLKMRDIQDWTEIDLDEYFEE